MQISRVQLKSINFSDFSFSLLPESYHNQISEELKESIRRIGILHPPIIKEGKHAFDNQIIAGRKRLEAARFFEFDSCQCIKLPYEIPYLETLTVLWEETINSALPSPIEQAKFFEKANHAFSIKEIGQHFLPPIGLSPSTDYINKKLRLLGLEEPLQVAIHEGKLSEQVGLELEELQFSDRMALFEVIDLLRLSVSNQKKLTRSCRELADRNQTTILSILSQPEFTDLLNNSNYNIPQKAGQLMKIIRNKRFPRLSEAEKDFQSFSASLSLPRKVSVSHDPSFEKDELTLTISCSGKEELQEIVSKLKN